MTEPTNPRLPYETPELYALPGAPVSRAPGRERRIPPMPEVAGVAVDELVRRYGSPLCVIDEAALCGGRTGASSERSAAATRTPSSACR
ncbi:MAG: hypothetical protein V2A76_17685 [Planctomycetota bacterium]